MFLYLGLSVSVSVLTPSGQNLVTRFLYRKTNQSINETNKQKNKNPNPKFEKTFGTFVK